MQKMNNKEFRDNGKKVSGTPIEEGIRRNVEEDIKSLYFLGSNLEKIRIRVRGKVRERLSDLIAEYKVKGKKIGWVRRLKIRNELIKVGREEFDKLWNETYKISMGIYKVIKKLREGEEKYKKLGEKYREVYELIEKQKGKIEEVAEMFYNTARREEFIENIVDEEMGSRFK